MAMLSLPGIGVVVFFVLTLLANNSTVWDVRAPGFEVPPGTRAVADFNGVSPRFFETLDIPLRAGRDFAAADGAPLATFAAPRRLALAVGNEGQGLSEELRAACDAFVSIPMADGAESLNVAVAAGILLHVLRPTA